jgi:glycosyltransferase involved in cell wall biosynthesis
MMDIRLLCLSHRDVMPPADGGRESIHGAIAALAKKADVTYAYPSAAACSAVEIAAARAAYAAINVRAIPVRFLARESLTTVAAATVQLLPYKFAKHATRQAVETFLAALESSRFDAVVCFHPHTVRLAERILARRGERLPIILREHNIEYALVESYARCLKFPLRLAATAYAWITRREERRIWRRVDAVALMSDADMKTAQATGVPANFVLAPEGVPLPPPRKVAWPGTSASLLVLFNPHAPQSVMNLRLFYQRYWNEVQAAGLLPGMRLAITGVEKIKLATLLGVSTAELDARNVVALSFVDCLPEVFRSSLALVSATFAGGGVRKKVLEAMAHQLPVIATPMDAGNCSFYRPNHNILRFDTVAEFVGAVKRLTQEPAFWLSLSQAGRTGVEQHANWQRFAEAMINEALRLVGETRAPTVTSQSFRTATGR